jgi:hypothetical protein
LPYRDREQLSEFLFIFRIVLPASSKTCYRKKKASFLLKTPPNERRLNLNLKFKLSMMKSE